MDRFRIDDPDAAEKAAQVLYKAGNWGRPTVLAVEAVRAVLDAIEQPRLPTRSQVEAKFRRRWGVQSVPLTAEWQEAATAAVRGYVDVMVDNEWATEDPEPAQVERRAYLGEIDRLRQLVIVSADVLELVMPALVERCQHSTDENLDLRMALLELRTLHADLLASGRVQVTP